MANYNSYSATAQMLNFFFFHIKYSGSSKLKAMVDKTQNKSILEITIVSKIEKTRCKVYLMYSLYVCS